MEEIHEEIKEAIKGLECFKYKYPKMETQDVIDMLKRLNENVKLTIPIVSNPKGTVCKQKGCKHRHVNEFDGYCLKHYSQPAN